MEKLKRQQDQLMIYQTKSGKIEFRGDLDHDTVWGTQQQIAEVFNIDRTVATRHINKIFKDREIDEKSNVQKMHIAKSDKPVKLYSLDVILAVGYRTNSSKAIAFRIWATKTLKQHLLQGYTINKKSISRNYNRFMRAVEDVKALLPAGNTVSAWDALELINVFASTWFSLNAYDEGKFPKKGASKKQVYFTGEELVLALQDLKRELIVRGQATGLFGQETNKDAVSGIVGNVFQSFAQQDVYPSIEEKAANLLYFMIKNHPFIDGNKRCGAFSFVWFLKRAGELSEGFTAEALTALTLLVAESRPKDKERLIGVVLLLLKKD